MKFPGGLIVQWTNAGPLVGNSSALLSFPIPFPNQLLVAVPYTGSTVAAQNLGVSVKPVAIHFIRIHDLNINFMRSNLNWILNFFIARRRTVFILLTCWRTMKRLERYPMT
ncbi:gp53-like domain-containing protein [Klebsiella pneumoniae]